MILKIYKKQDLTQEILHILLMSLHNFFSFKITITSDLIFMYFHDVCTIVLMLNITNSVISN